LALSPSCEGHQQGRAIAVELPPCAYRVVILALIGDYTNWAPVKGREQKLLKVSKDLAHFYGAEMRFLNYASGRFQMNAETNLAVAKVVADVQPTSRSCSGTTTAIPITKPPRPSAKSR